MLLLNVCAVTGNRKIAYRSRLEKFAEHQLATAHSCFVIPDTLPSDNCQNTPGILQDPIWLN
jgi:hypothetical protein